VQAFDVLERLDPDPTYWEGKRGACIGVFQQVIAGEEPDRALSEVVQILRNTTNNPRVDKIVRVMNLWARDNGVALDEVEDDEA
jgi:intraflagellar transport protein 56